MSAPELVMHLSTLWNIRHPTSLVATDRMTGCRWRHSHRELPNSILPANTLVLRMGPVKSCRIQGGRKAQTVSTRLGMGLCPQGSDGRWLFESDVDVFHFYFSNTLLSRVADMEGTTSVELRDQLMLEDPVLKTLALEAASAASEGTQGVLYADTLGTAMSFRLIRAHRSGAGPAGQRAAPPSRGGMSTRNLKRVTDYLVAHLDQDVSLAELAKVAGLTPFHFCRAFKQSTGLSPHMWLLSQRMEMAKHLMHACPAMGLTEVALAVGYASQSTFGTAFKRYVGTTPGKWQRDRLL